MNELQNKFVDYNGNPSSITFEMEDRLGNKKMIKNVYIKEVVETEKSITIKLYRDNKPHTNITLSI